MTTVNVVQLETASDIAERRNDVLSQYKSFKDALTLRRQQLQDVLELQNFRRDANELEKWIAEKMAVAKDENWKDLTNLENRLQKHAALEAEINANAGVLKKLDDAGEQMIENDHFAKPAVKDRLDELHRLWNDLLNACKYQGERLRQMHALVDYIRECDEVLSWIKDKEAVIASDEEGKDVGHVQMLQRKNDELQAEIAAQGDRVKEVKDTADRMVDEENHPEADTIREKQKEVADAWEHLNDLAKEKNNNLAAAAEVQQFKQDVEETIDRMNEKEKVLLSNDVGHDVPSVQALQRRHEGVERDLAALEEKVAELQAEADRLEKDHDDLSMDQEKDAIADHWDRVTDAAKRRKKDLEESYDLHKFLAECRDLVQWSEDMEDRMLASDLVPDVAGSEALLDKHQEYKGEIGAHEEGFRQTIEFGERLIEQGHPASLPDVRERSSSTSSSSSSSSSSSDDEKRTTEPKAALIPTRLQEVKERKQEVLRIWEERQSLFDQCLHLALFNRDADNAEAWLTAQESQLKEHDLGDSLDSVQALLRKHDDLIKSAEAQEEKIHAVDEHATKLIDAGHYAADEIGARRDIILSRNDVLRRLMVERQAALTDSLKLQSFQRDVRNIRSWIADKSKIATDEAHQDPSNLEGKLDRHTVFEAEVLANEERVLECCDVGNKLVQDGHYAAEEIANNADTVKKEWEELLAHTKERGELLEDACAEQAFNRTVSDLNRWMEDVEVQLASEDVGKDVESVESLLKRHHLMDTDIAVHKDRIDGVEVQAQKFVEDDHFNKVDIKEKQEALSERYEKLKAPDNERKDKLAESLIGKQSFRDMQDEMEWIQDKQPLVTATNTDIDSHAFGAPLLRKVKWIFTPKACESIFNKPRLDAKLVVTIVYMLFYRSSAIEVSKDLMSTHNLVKKHSGLQAEIAAHEQRIQAVCDQAGKLIEEGHFEAEALDAKEKTLENAWKDLKETAEGRKKNLDDALEAQQYLADANEAQSWMEEKGTLISSTDYGADEDSADSLLKKQEALMSDVEAFSSTVEALHEQAEACKLQDPWASDEKVEKVMALQHYKARTARELSVKKGDTLILLSSHNKDWWKVEATERQGFVPASVLRVVFDEKRSSESSDSSSSSSDDEDEKKSTHEEEVDGAKEAAHPATIMKRQEQIEDQYERLKIDCNKRTCALERSRRRHALLRECEDLQKWMDDKRAEAAKQDQEDEGSSSDDEDRGLEAVEKQQKKLDEFQKELKAKEKRMEELNAEAKALDRDTSSSSSSSSDSSDDDDPDKIVAAKVRDLNEQWESLRDMVSEKTESLGSAHQVQRYFRDADETKEWIDEKSQALDTDNLGSDLPTVQALQRKHDAFERDLAALKDHVQSLDSDASRLIEKHPDQEESIQQKRNEINEAWVDLDKKAEERKKALSDSYDLQRFLSDRRELQRWMRHMHTLVSSDEVADDMAGAEALLERHQEHRSEMDARAPAFSSLEKQADALAQADHYAASDVDAALQETSKEREELEKAWAARRILLEQCSQFHSFLRDCENAENWMQAREAFLGSDQDGDSLDSVESLIKKHEDFDRAIGLQEDKMKALQASAEKLQEQDPPHYASEAIKRKADDVQDRWQELKAALIDKRSKLGETQTLQQFSRDADELEAWMTEKMQTATDDSYKDPSNIQSKHQKHEAFEAELDANDDRVNSVINNGRQLIDNHQCAGSEDAVQARIESLADQWEELRQKSAEKGSKLKEANQQQNFITAVKDLEFWMSEVETILMSEDVGRDVPSVNNLLANQRHVESDIAAHDDRVRELTAQAEVLLGNAEKSDALDPAHVESKKKEINDRFAKIKDIARERRGNLQESLSVHQFFKDVVDEEAWINEKKLQAGSEDCGRDVISVSNLVKKHKRIEGEISSHEPNIERLKDSGDKLSKEVESQKDEIEKRVNDLSEHWDQLKDLAKERKERLDQARDYQQFRTDCEEETSWINEKMGVLVKRESPESLAAATSLLKKHEAFETDLAVHQDRIADVEKEGNKLVKEDNPEKDGVKDILEDLEDKKEKLEEAARDRRSQLQDIHAFLQFNWEADVVESWIAEREKVVKSDDFGRDLSQVQSLLTKQETFEAGLDAFEQERIANITALKNHLLDSGHEQSDDIQERHDALMKRWDDLRKASAERKDRLLESQERLRGVDDLYLQFAKRASAFNSWFENVEEDLTDPVRCYYVKEIEELIMKQADFRKSLKHAEDELKSLHELDEKLSDLTGVRPPVNPYTWFTGNALNGMWKDVQRLANERDVDLDKEKIRQEENEKLRLQFAKEANDFHKWLTETRVSMVEESGTLESQLEATKLKSKEVKEAKSKLHAVEKIGAIMEDALILDNSHTEHSTVGLAQQWDQLDQLGMRMQHNLEQQIQARNMTGVSEETLKEISMMFKHFDKDKTGKLEHHEFKSCLRSLGYDLPMVEEGVEDPEFQAILDMVDPNRDGVVSLQEYMAFMISRETENVKSLQEVESAFSALSAEGRAYVTREELYQNLSRDQADFCIKHMPPYTDSHGIEVLNAYDYAAFTRQLFME